MSVTPLSGVNAKRAGRASSNAGAAVLVLVALVTVAPLAGCGGGGGSGSGATTGSTTTSPTTPTTSTPYNADLVTSVSAPTYAAGTTELGAWKVLQDERAACGFGLLQQDTRLDQANKAHADYMTALSTSTGVFYSGHGESAGTAGYTGSNALSRAVAAGWPSGTSVTEVIDTGSSTRPSASANAYTLNEAQGAQSMRLLLTSVYHLSGTMNSGRFVGLGSSRRRAAYAAASGYDFEVYEFGGLIGTISSPQLLGSGVVASYPCAGATHVSGTFVPALESPNPFPDVTSASTVYGTPIYLKIDSGHTLVVSSSTVTASNGTAIAARSVAGSSDPTGELGAHEVFVVPTQALVAGQRYTVAVTGTVDGTAFTKTFGFIVAP